MHMVILDSGERETLKASVHAVALGITVVMDAYNFAAWVKRHERHLAFNTLVYTALAFFEWGHIQHHRASAFAAAAALTAATASAIEAASSDRAA